MDEVVKKLKSLSKSNKSTTLANIFQNEGKEVSATLQKEYQKIANEKKNHK